MGGINVPKTVSIQKAIENIQKYGEWEGVIQKGLSVYAYGRYYSIEALLTSVKDVSEYGKGRLKLIQH